ncbi:MAG: DUF1499 domain-containing protein [Deltaproteobacteria bacterium]|nr:DUF1499 domain-containing protein [Deltaproteobacteria bacterium]
MASPEFLQRVFARPLALGFALLLGGPLAASTGLAPPLVGFGMYVLGGLLTGVAGVVGAGLVRRAGGAWGILLGSGLLGLALVLGPAVAGGSAPPINDISTDTSDPPPIDSLRTLDGVGLDMSYDPGVAAITREAYGDVVGFTLDASPKLASDRAQRCLTDLGGRRVTGAAPPDEPGPVELLVQATFVTSVFGFHDDVVLRLRTEGRGSRVDVRSKSRDGKGDLGANAKRIRAISDCMTNEAAPG